MINIFQPCLGDEELALIKEVFASNWIGKGNSTLAFEKGFAEMLKADPAHFTSTTSCTEGLFLATELFDIGPGDEVIVPTCSFVAVGNAVIASGAQLVFCDVDSRTLNVTAAHLTAVITPRTKAVYLTHYAGVACDMDPIMELCAKHHIVVIEDAACAVRSFYKGRACGTIGDMGIWSFDAMKTICTGDGGMIYLRRRELVEVAKESLYLGLPNRQKSGMDSSAQGSANWWEYQIERPGRRAIMNNIAGAIGLAQLRKVDGFLARRRAIHDRYEAELKGLPWLQLPPEIPAHCESSYYFFWVQSPARSILAKYLLDHGVYSTFRYWPLHKLEFFRTRATVTGLSGAEYAASHTLDIPLHQSLSETDVTTIISLIRAFKG